MTATRIDRDTSQDGTHRYEIIHFSTAHRLPNPYFLPEYNPNRPGPPPRTIYDVRDEANPDIQYYWASVPPDPYFAPSEKARKEGARTIYDVAGQQYHTVLVAAIPAGNKPSSVNSNVAAKPHVATPVSTITNRSFTPDPPYSQEELSNIFSLDSNPLWTYIVSQKCAKSTSEEHTSLLRNTPNTSQGASLPATPPALPDAFPYSTEHINCPPFMDFPPLEEYLNQAVDTSMDVDIDDSLFASDAPTPDFSPPFDTNPPPPPLPPLPPFTPTSDDWEAHMRDTALADKHERGRFIHEILKEDNLTFDRVESNAAYPSCPSSSMFYPSLSIPQLQGDDQASSSDLSVMLKLLKLFLEETATRPARVEDLNPLELTFIMELSEQFRGGFPPSAAVKACAQACGLSTRRVIAYFFTLNPEPLLPLLSPHWQQSTPLDRESREYRFMTEAEALASAEYAPLDALAFEEAERRWQESQARVIS